MFGYDYNWEAIGVLITVFLFCLSCLWWLIKMFWAWRVERIQTKQKELIKAEFEKHFTTHIKRIDELEADMKANAAANMKMSETFHSHLNKILYTFAGRDVE